MENLIELIIENGIWQVIIVQFVIYALYNILGMAK